MMSHTQQYLSLVWYGYSLCYLIGFLLQHNLSSVEPGWVLDNRSYLHKKCLQWREELIKNPLVWLFSKPILLVEAWNDSIILTPVFGLLNENKSRLNWMLFAWSIVTHKHKQQFGRKMTAPCRTKAIKSANRQVSSPAFSLKNLQTDHPAETSTVYL